MAVKTKNSSMKTAPNGKIPAISVLADEWKRIPIITYRIDSTN